MRLTETQLTRANTPPPLRAARGRVGEGAGVASQSAPILTFPRKRGKGPSDVVASKYTPSLARSAGEGWGGGGCGVAAHPHPRLLLRFKCSLAPQAGEGVQ